MSFGSIASIAVTESEIQYTKLTRAYIWGFVYTVIGAIIAVSLGVMLNKTGWMGGNFVLAAIFLVAWAFLTFYPGSIAIAFGIGGLKGLPKDWSINRLLREGALPDLQLSNVAKEGLEFAKKCLRWSAHLALFSTVVFVTLGTWKIESGSVVLPVFVVLAGVGLWAVLFTKGTVLYKRVTITILLVALVGLLYRAYVYVPPQDETADLIDKTMQLNNDARKQQVAKALYEKVRQGASLTPEEIRILESLKHESKRVTNTVNGVTASLPKILPFSDQPSKQKWDMYDEKVTCHIRWNAEKNGPWCYVGKFPPGSYRIMPQSSGMWQQAIPGADEKIYYHNIPARGILLRSIWNPPDRPYREFLRMAPIGGNAWFGRLIARVGEKTMYDPYEDGYFTVTEMTEVVIGPNLPPLESYVAMNLGEVSFDIERLRQ